jgi:hypothetical protein
MLARVARYAALVAALAAGGVPVAVAEPRPAAERMIAAHPAVGPGEVVVGVYLNQITAISLRENSFNADFYVWFRWQGAGEYKPLESFELMNGKVESKGSVVEKKIGDLNYVSARVLATINKPWDLRSFPLDSHTLEIQLEDSMFEQGGLRFVADDKNIGRNPAIQLSGWTIHDVSHRIGSHLYRTNYGDVSLPSGNESRYSRFTYVVEIGRPGWLYSLKYFSTVLISTFVAFLAFLIRPTNLDPRFGLGIGALFAVVASGLVVASSLPESDTLTLADLVHLASIAVIFCTLFISAISLRAFESGREPFARRLDRTCLALLPLGYASACLALVPARAWVG